MNPVVKEDKRRFGKVLQVLLVASVIGLASTVYYYPIRNHVPSGADSSVYINDVRWILKNHRLPIPNQAITHGIQAYPSPGTETVVTLLVRITNGSVTEVFAWYQLSLMILLFLTTYLVGRLFNRRLALLYIIALFGSFSLYHLYIGSVVSNLMAFSITNLIFYYSIILSRVTRKMPYVILIAFLFVVLYLFHSYLTAPIFIGVYSVYLLFLLAIKKELRNQIRIFVNKRSKITLYITGLLILGILTIVVKEYQTIGLIARQAFTSSNPNDKFRYIVDWNQIGTLVGQPIWNLSILGLLLFLIGWKQNIRSWRVFPFLWVVVLWILMQSYHLGINFYFERLVLLAGIAIPFFAAMTLAKGLHTKFAPALISLFVVIMLISGVDYMVGLFQASNFVGNDQLNALQSLAKIVTPADMVLSNNNGVAATRHDLIVTDANFMYYPSVQKKCAIDEAVCNAFTRPSTNGNLDILKSANVRYILLLKPNYESNADLDILMKQYSQTAGIQTVYYSSEASLYSIR